jgi:protoheme IX farnesyltransferase
MTTLTPTLGPTPPTGVSPRTDPAQIEAARRELFAATMELTKPRITRLVTITAAVGFVVGACSFATWDVPGLMLAGAACLAGTALSAAGANTLNQWIERRRDALMPRTAERPLPTGRIEATTGLWIGVLLAAAGVTLLLSLVGLAPALVSLATILLYTLVYTPLKPVTILATIVGAVPGALPPLIGWTAAATVLHTPGPTDGAWWAVLAPLADVGGWSLFWLMVVWQLPHFWAIAWMYKDDYAQGGFRMLPIIDPTGRLTAWAIVVSAALLVPALAWPALAMPGVLSAAYLTLAVASGVGYFALTLPLLSKRDRVSARRVFIASVIHLPLILMAMVADALLVRLVF